MRVGVIKTLIASIIYNPMCLSAFYIPVLVLLGKFWKFLNMRQIKYCIHKSPAFPLNLYITVKYMYTDNNIIMLFVYF